MRSPNPSSFKNFSAQKKKSKKGGFWVPAFFLAMLGAVGFLIWNHHSCSPRLTEKRRTSISSHLPPITGEQPKAEESYIDFDKAQETGEAISPDMEEEEDRSPPPTDSELVQIFKSQENQNLSPFSQPTLWKKNAQKKIIVPRGKAEVAVVLEGIETFSPKDWKTLYNLNIPLTFIFSASHPEAPQMSQKAWSKGREIFVRGKNKGETLEKRFPRLLGTVDEKISSLPSHLELSESKGLKGGLHHRVFSFPLIRDKKAFIKSNRSIIWVTSRDNRLRALSEWIQQQKKKVVFIPISQLYAHEEGPKRGAKTIEIKKIKEGRINLA